MSRTGRVLGAAVVLATVATPAVASDSPELVANPRHAVVENLAPGQVRTLLSTIENISRVDAAMAITAVSEGAAAEQIDPVQMTIDVCTVAWAEDPSGTLACGAQEFKIVDGWQVQGTVSTDSTLRIPAGDRVYLRTQVSLTGDDVPSAIQGRSRSIAFAVSASEAPPIDASPAQPQPALSLPITGASMVSAAAWAGGLLAVGVAMTVSARRRRHAQQKEEK